MIAIGSRRVAILQLLQTTHLCHPPTELQPQQQQSQLFKALLQQLGAWLTPSSKVNDVNNCSDKPKSYWWLRADDHYS